MSRYISDEVEAAYAAFEARNPSIVAEPGAVPSGQQMIDAERAQGRAAIQEEVDKPGIFARFINPAIEKIDGFYKEVEQNYVAGIDFVGSAVTGNERLTLEDTYKVSPGQAIEANIQALWDDSVKLADDGWREGSLGCL